MLWGQSLWEILLRCRVEVSGNATLVSAPAKKLLKSTVIYDNLLTDKGVFWFLPLFSLYTGIHPKENGSAFGE